MPFLEIDIFYFKFDGSNNNPDLARTKEYGNCRVANFSNSDINVVLV